MRLFKNKIIKPKSTQYGQIEQEQGSLSLPVFETEAVLEPAYRIVIKRNDKLYQGFILLNTILSVFGVLLIVALFGVVFWGLLTITEVREVLAIMKAQAPVH